MEDLTTKKGEKSKGKKRETKGDSQCQVTV